MAKKKLNRLKEVLEREGVSLYAVAKEADISYSLIHGYLDGKREPNLTTLFKIAKVLKVDPCDLLNK